MLEKQGVRQHDGKQTKRPDQAGRDTRGRDPQKDRGDCRCTKDVIMGLPLIHLTGQCEICIENYRGILEYTEELIRVKTKSGTIRIIGKRMCIEYYMNDEMKITGKIWKVEFEKKEDAHC